MSQFNFTAEEDALMVSALNVLAEVQAAGQGAPSDAVVALLAKIAEQQTPNVPVVGNVTVSQEVVGDEVVTEVVTEEKPAKGKKAKAVEAE